MRFGLAATLAVCAAVVSGPAAAGTSYDVIDWSDLRGWEDDQHEAALSVFLETCPDLSDEVWSSVCAVAGRSL